MKTMNGEIPQIPITTLSGLTSLTELLPHLPLPGPLDDADSATSGPGGPPSTSLLFSQKFEVLLAAQLVEENLKAISQSFQL